MIHLSTRVVTNRDLGLTVVIDCPHCGSPGVTASCWDQTETLQFLIRKTTTWVRCPVCGGTLYSNEPCAAITQKSPAELHGVVVRRVSLINRFFVGTALVLAIFPILGLPVSLVSLVVNWRNRSLRKWSLIAVGISAVVSVIVICLLAGSSESGSHH